MHIIFKEKRIPVLYCSTFWKRLIGMSFKRSRQAHIYCFPRCNSIHTFFMMQTIDIIMTSKDHTIVYAKENVKPNRIIFPKKKVFYTFEFSHDQNLFIQLTKQKNIHKFIQNDVYDSFC